MEFEERPLLHSADLMLALLRAGRREAATAEDAVRLLGHELAAAHEDDPPDQAEMLSRLERARRHLAAARLLEMLDDSRFRITPRGRSMLRRHPDGIDDSLLMGSFPEYRQWLRRQAAPASAADPRAAEFQHGWAAQREGTALADNPFALETAQHAAWADGWMEAQQ